MAKKTVRLYLRAWKEGTPKPSTWQMTWSDASSKRISSSGPTYLWVSSPKGTPTIAMPYSVDSVTPYSAASADSIDVGASFPSPSDHTFSIAVIGDTQAETDSSTDQRFGDRTSWLAKNKDLLDLRYVIHSGDVVNFGWLEPKQYTLARVAMATLTGAKLPWLAAVGNHDTRAVGWNNVPGSTGYGGGPYSQNPECPKRLPEKQCRSSILIRETQEFNKNFPVADIANLGGTFEENKIDNSWTSFKANNTKWLVINIEFAPRKAAAEWARKVVAAHLDHNVIVNTHHYLTRSGTISKSNSDYGESSPKYIYDTIVSKYPNVKIVASGHTGQYTSRTDTNKKNTTVAYLGNIIGWSDSPVRILTIDTSTGQLSNTVYRRITDDRVIYHSSGSVKISIIK